MMHFRKIYVDADYGSTAFWDEEGAMIELEELPISTELKVRSQKWADQYWCLLDFVLNREGIDSFKARMRREQEEIARLLQDELPDTEVVVSDQFA